MLSIRKEKRLWLYCLLICMPGMLLSIILLLNQNHPIWKQALWIGLGWFLPITLSAWVIEKIRRPIMTLSNQVGGMREGDFSIQVRGSKSGGALGMLASDINSLSNHFKESRLESVETAALLRTVMEEINPAVFAFDTDQRLQLVNRAGEQLLGKPANQLKSKSATELGLKPCLEGEPSRIMNVGFSGKFGRWGLRRTTFREQGKPHHLLVLSDLSRTLRDEERQAWKRLIRVLGHELNNSLAPIQSISSCIAELLAKQPRPEDWEADVVEGVTIIQTRSESLSRFMESYSRLARLPHPVRSRFHLQDWIQKVVRLERRMEVALTQGPDVLLHADQGQLEQALINLLQNAVDAALSMADSRPAQVELIWSVTLDNLQVIIRDNGPGIPETSNLFVPFFTTKSKGSGIGLALSRQIIEAHNGELSLRNRTDGMGAEAIVHLSLDELQVT